MSDSTDALKQIHYLAAALKAPRITEAAARLAGQARDASWTHEEYLAAVLEREVSARNASGAQLRIRAAGFPARKTLEDFDWDAQPAIRQQIAALASGGFLTEARNIRRTQEELEEGQRRPCCWPGCVHRERVGR
jgi:DNA replication protein DnaC